MFIQEIAITDVVNFKNNCVFNTIDWLKIYEQDKLALWGIFNKNKELIGVFHTYKYKRAKFFKQIASAPFCPSNGLYVKSNSINPSQKNTFQKKVVKLISEFLLSKPVSILSFSFPPNIIDTQPLYWSDFNITPKYTYQLDLNLTEEELFANMSSERRKNIRKAKKDGIKSVLEIKSKNAEKLIKSTFKDQQLKVDYKVLSNILNQFSTQHNTLCFVSYNKNKKPIATAFCVYDDKQAYYLFGGYDNNNKHEGAGALAMWEAIKYAKNKQISIFDFEGSMVPKIEQYFRGFGGELVPYYVVQKAKTIPHIILTKAKGKNY